MPDALRAWMTPPEVAEYLGVDNGKVLTWIRAGELTAVNVATRRGSRPRWRIRVDELERFLCARRSEAAPKSARRPRRQDDVIAFY